MESRRGIREGKDFPSLPPPTFHTRMLTRGKYGRLSQVIVVAHQPGVFHVYMREVILRNLAECRILWVHASR